MIPAGWIREGYHGDHPCR